LKEFLSPAAASNWLKEGKILIHPTEGVWGLGCDASNINACEKISLLKQRTNNKSFILLAPSIPFALACTAEVAPSQIEFLESIWPGHITVIMQANESILSHIKTLNNTVGIRVSNHLPIINLLNSFNNLMVSTSANISEFPTPNMLAEVKKTFNDPDVAVYAHDNGDALKPSAIIDLDTMEYIRE
jgi:L-threonylcarbamoyladenylate synthase